MVENGDGDHPDSEYDPLADREGRDGWDSPWGDNPLQEHYAWPATRAVLGDVDGERVLDAGCGVGDHVEWLLEAGATVVGVDVSGPAVERARERFGDRVTFRRADLTEPLAFADDGTFDVVLAHLVLDHVEEWTPVFEEFHRVLAGGGVVVFAVVHPLQYYLEYDAVTSYYDVQPVEVGWDAPVTSYHRPVGDVLEPLVGAGFRLETFEEPRPRDEYLEHADDRWNPTERPQVLCVRARASP